MNYDWVQLDNKVLQQYSTETNSLGLTILKRATRAALAENKYSPTAALSALVPPRAAGVGFVWF